MAQSKLYPVVMAGGSGSRLWYRFPAYFTPSSFYA
ncbi:Mannose-1-phosphate guanylyltransferase [Escherichia coli]|nr:Mannose-1-phosphate guanylyltransferase [Escherichia coli]